MSHFPKLFIAFFLISLFISCQPAKEKALEGGWLWKISGNGLEKPSYLFGTWHGSFDISYSYVDSIPGFHAAFDACNQQIGEVNLLEDNNMLMLQNIKMPADTTYADLLDEQEYHFLDSLTMHSLGAPLNQVHIKPALLAITLQQVKEIKKLIETGISQSQIDSMHNQVMDLMIEKKAKEKNYTLVGLETLQQQMDYLMNPDDLKDQAIQSVKSLQVPAIGEELTKKLVQAYRSQDINVMVAYEVYADSVCRKAFADIPGFDALYFQNTMIRQRNENWAEKIPALIQSKPSFIAVGVRHLPGENGLISLLQQKGYRVEACK